MDYIETSAKDNSNINEVFEKIVNMLMNVPIIAFDQSFNLN